MSAHTSAPPAPGTFISVPDAAEQRKKIILIFKWGISLLSPFLSLLIPDSAGLTPHMKAFLGITIWAIIVWGVGIIPEVAVAMALPVFYVLAGLLPYKAAMSSWTDPLTIVVIGGLVIGYVVMETGLTRRIALWGVSFFAGSISGLLLGMSVAVMIVCPLVPSSTGKTILFSVIAIGLCDALGFKPKSRESTIICLGAFLAVSCSKLCWLTGAGDVVLPISIMDQTTEHTTSWLTYAAYNALPGVLYTAVSMAAIVLLLRTKGRANLREAIGEQYSSLPRMGKQEKKAAAMLVVTVLLLLTEPLHGMPTAYTMLLMGLVCFLPQMGLITGKAFGGMNINVIFFINGCMSIGICAHAVGMDKWMVDCMWPLLQGGSTLTRGLLCYVVGLSVNFLLTPVAAFVSLTGPITQMGVNMNMDPAILVHSFQYGVDQHLFPYQYAPFMLVMGMGYIGFKDMLIVMLARMFITALLLAVCIIPFWSFVSAM